MEQILVPAEEFLKGRLRMACQQTDPGLCDGLVIQAGYAMVLRELLNSRTNTGQRRFPWFPMKMEPRQPEMVCVAELGSAQPAGMEGGKKLIVTEMSRSQRERHTMRFRKPDCGKPQQGTRPGACG